MVVALPALLPFSPSILTQAPDPHLDLSGLMLSITTAPRTPGLSLGVALAVADPLVVQQLRTAGRHGPSPRAVAGIALGATMLVGGFILTVAAPLECTPSGELGAQVCVIRSPQLPASYPCGIAIFAAVGGLVGVWLGYALGAAIAGADRWT